jgi:hypothetical protein
LDSSNIDRYFWRNVLGVSAVEFLWGLGLPVVVESTFLQLFLKHLGASSLALGLIPFFFFIGTSVFALFSSYLTAGRMRQRRPVVVLHVVSGLALLLFGAVLWVVAAPRLLLPAFFCCYAVFSLFIGMTLPVWLNYLVKIFSEARAISGLAYMMIAQGIAKLASSLMIVHVVQRYAFGREASAIVFLAVGGLFCIGSLFFYCTRELDGPSLPAGDPRPPFRVYCRATLRHMASNRNFLWFIGGDLDFFIVVTVISYYAAYAIDFGGVSAAAAAGVFVGLINAGAILANILLGARGWLSLKNKALFSKALAFLAVVGMALWAGPWSFYSASLLLGASRGTRMLVYAPAIKKLSGLGDATGYFAVAPILSLPLATGLPMLCGAFLDRFAHLQGESYRIVFALAALLLAGAFACTLKVDFAARDRSP